MNRINLDDHVLARPVEKLPEYAHAKARRTLAERLVTAFRMSEPAATAIADAVVDPSAVRSSIGEPTDPQVEQIAVPGGHLLGIRTQVWARRVMPDPRNPRIGPSRRHPFAVDPGTGGEESRFRPVPEPRSPETGDTVPELVVDLESRHHLEWASAQAAKYVFAENDWRTSIAMQGVMEAVWLAPTTYRHADGSASATALTTVEGSSRATAVHHHLGVRSADVPYEQYDHAMRARIRRLNEALDRGPTGEQLIELRCERIPALILVGFEKNSTGTAGFPTAVKSLVALRHVDPPKPWGEGPESESLADEVLDELYRQGLISATERDYYAGSCTRAEAREAHLSDDPAVRAARLVHLFTTDDPQIYEAIRVAVTSQSTRKRLTPKLRNELATALIVRALGDTAKIDQVRRYMRHAFGKSVHAQRPRWQSTDRDVEVLAKEALREVRLSIGDATITDPGPASLELAVRAAYPLIVDGRLHADRGTADNDQPDRRTPGEVLDVMRRKIDGVHQLAQALRDYGAEAPIRAVDESGAVRHRTDGAGEQIVTDYYLRVAFPPPGKVRARPEGTTPAEVLQKRLADVSDAMDQLEVAFTGVRTVLGIDGTALVDADGVDPQLCGEWRKTLEQVGNELFFWGKVFALRHGRSLSQGSDGSRGRDGEDDSEAAEIEEAYASSYEAWAEGEEGQPVDMGEPASSN